MFVTHCVTLDCALSCPPPQVDRGDHGAVALEGTLDRSNGTSVRYPAPSERTMSFVDGLRGQFGAQTVGLILLSMDSKCPTVASHLLYLLLCGARQPLRFLHSAPGGASFNMLPADM